MSFKSEMAVKCDNKVFDLLLREILEQSPTLKEGTGSAGEISEESE